MGPISVNKVHQKQLITLVKSLLERVMDCFVVPLQER